MGGQYETNTGFACCRDFAAFGSLIGSIGLGLPRRRSRLWRLRAQLLRHRCQAHRAASMRELQPDPCLHHPVVSARRLKSPGKARAATPPGVAIRPSTERGPGGRPVRPLSDGRKGRVPELLGIGMLLPDALRPPNRCGLSSASRELLEFDPMQRRSGPRS